MHLKVPSIYRGGILVTITFLIEDLLLREAEDAYGFEKIVVNTFKPDFSYI